MPNVIEIEKQAKEEIRSEEHQEAVMAMKVKLREHRSIWQRLFPYRIFIEKV